MDFRHLLEARVRDFQKRKEEGDVRPAPAATVGKPLEAVLMVEIRDLRKSTKEASNAEIKAELEAKALKLITQLTMLLESSGRPLAARLLADRLSED